MMRFNVLLLVSFFTMILHVQGTEILVANVTWAEDYKVIKTEWRAPSTKVAVTPEWNLTDKALPLSSDQAIKIAFNNVQKQFPSIKDWRLNFANLVKITNGGNADPAITNKFCYLINFVASSDTDTESIKKAGKESGLYQVILLDGTLLEPKVTVTGN